MGAVVAASAGAVVLAVVVTLSSGGDGDAPHAETGIGAPPVANVGSPEPVSGAQTAALEPPGDCSHRHWHEAAAAVHRCVDVDAARVAKPLHNARVAKKRRSVQWCAAVCFGRHHVGSSGDQHAHALVVTDEARKQERR